MRLESEVEMTLVPVNFINEVTTFIRANMTHLQAHDMVQRLITVGEEGRRLAREFETKDGEE